MQRKPLTTKNEDKAIPIKPRRKHSIAIIINNIHSPIRPLGALQQNLLIAEPIHQ